MKKNERIKKLMIPDISTIKRCFFIKRNVFCLAFVFLLMWGMNVCFAQDKIVAIVNDDVITQKDLNDFINFMRVELSRDYKGAALKDKIESMEEDLLGRLIEDKLILQEAKNSDIVIEESRIRQRIDEIKKRYNSEREFREGLMAQGFSESDIHDRIRDQMLMIAVIQEKVRARIEVSPDEVTHFYERNKEKFVTSEERKIESLLTEDEAAAQDISEKARKNGEFQECVGEYSLTVNTFTARKGELKPELEKIIFDLDTGAVSSPFKIDEKYYIFRLAEVRPPRKLPLDEAQDEINRFLFEKKMQENLAGWLSGLKKRAYIKIIH